jgi:hypothetical protein
MAMGCIGLTFDDFCNSTFEEFEAISKAWSDMREATEKGDWERMRLLAAICIQPHVKKKITPQALVPLPWDNGKRKQKAAGKAQPTAAECKQRFEKLVHRTDAHK